MEDVNKQAHADDSVKLINDLTMALEGAKKSLSVLKEDNDRLSEENKEFNSLFEEATQLIEDLSSKKETDSTNDSKVKKEIDDLKKEVKKLSDDKVQLEKKLESTKRDLEKELVSDAILQAQDVKSQTIKKAQEDADAIVKKARKDATEIVNDATSRAESEATAILTAARTKADREQGRYESLNNKVLETVKTVTELEDGLRAVLRQNNISQSEIKALEKVSDELKKSNGNTEPNKKELSMSNDKVKTAVKNEKHQQSGPNKAPSRKDEVILEEEIITENINTKKVDGDVAVNPTAAERLQRIVESTKKRDTANKKEKWAKL